MGNRVSRITDALSRRKKKETGQDPAENCADLEDRSYNNDSFKQTAEAAAADGAQIEVHVSQEEGAALEVPVGVEKVTDPSAPEDEGKEEEMKTSMDISAEEILEDAEDLNNAAAKIQAGFKGYKVRKEAKELKNESAAEDVEEDSRYAGISYADEVADIDLNDPDMVLAANKIQANFRGYQVRKNLNNKKPSEPTGEETTAATTTTTETTITVEGDINKSNSKEIIDIDLTDPEVNAAATKIQASFRGHQIRQQFKDKEQDPESEEAVSAEEATKAEAEAVAAELISESSAADQDDSAQDDKLINYDDPQVHMAASKIQAGFKGYKTRKSLKESTTESEDPDKDSES